ncbi:MAG: DUF2169 domain-containing protein, partial [Polyangiaceae bacterium]|nr:DUF2169 domain-containing protein [Polyangiaceae bacterium]
AHAFGGEGFAQNPSGKGLRPTETDHGELHFLPNVEDPKALIVGRRDQPRPAGFAPYDVTWPQRFEKVGTYDRRWLETLFPGPAVDFDPHFYNTAPADQQLTGFFNGDEAFLLEGMHPEGRIEGRFERFVMRAFVTRRGEPPRTLTEVPLRLDTVHFVPHLRRAVLSFRGVCPVCDDDADDIEVLMLAAEDPSQPRDVAHYRRVLELRTDKDKAVFAILNDRDLMPPEGEGWTSRIDAGDVGEMLHLDLPALDNQARGRKRALDEARDKLAEAGFDPDGEGVAWSDPLELPPDPNDIEAIAAFVEKLAARGAEERKAAEQQQADMQARSREKFKELGLDWDEEAKKAVSEGGGPPTFVADEHLAMLHDMAHLSAHLGAPLAELERDLTDPAFERMLHDVEEQQRDSYRRYAQLMPAAGPIDPEAQLLARGRVQAAKDSGTSLARANLTRVDLAGLDLAGVDFSGALLEGANLAGADLTGANLTNAVLARADLTATRAAGANLTGANLGAAKLCQTDLSGAVLDGTVLWKATLDGTRLCGARLRNLHWLEVDIVAADMSGVDAEKMFLWKVDLSRIVFRGAHLELLIFVECNATGTDFSEGDLSRCQFFQTRGDGARFTGTKFHKGVITYESSFAGASFAGADLSGTNLRGTVLTGADFTGAKLTGADLSKCALAGGKLYRISARQALCTRTDFSGADLRAADLLGAILQKADLRGADLRGANLARADISRARFDGKSNIADALMLDTRVEPRYVEPKAEEVEADGPR